MNKIQVEDIKDEEINYLLEEDSIMLITILKFSFL